jgi:hypothetical protein
MVRYLLGLLLLATICLRGTPTYAAQPPAITDRGATLEFPNAITFAADLRADSEISTIVLEYGVEQRTCGEVLALAYPEYTAGNNASVSWTWDMRQSGSLPPGATIWYRWRATDSSGQTVTSETQRITWLDDLHSWKTIRRDLLNLHWYEGDRAFALALLESASNSLGQLGNDTGVVAQRPIDIYIYSSSADMREAVLYEPGWTGGLAYSDYSLTIIGVAPDQLSWGRRVIAHELTHVLVGNQAFSCIGSIPTWLNEGIAVYGEGGPETYSLNALSAAIENDTLLSVRSLSGGFSEDPGQADLSYVQSYSIVRYLITEYGREKLLGTFDRLAQGDDIEQVLQETYGFGLDGLEDRWRVAIQAAPRRNAGEAATPTALAGAIPTIAPIEPGSRIAANPTPQPQPTTNSVVEPTTTIPVPDAPAPTQTPDRLRTIFIWAAWIFLSLAAIGASILIGLYYLSKRGRS